MLGRGLSSCYVQVGNAFVHQYYNILHQSPELVYRFYQEASCLGRPAGTGADGMDTVTTMDVSSSPTRVSYSPAAQIWSPQA